MPPGRLSGRGRIRLALALVAIVAAGLIVTSVCGAWPGSVLLPGPRPESSRQGPGHGGIAATEPSPSRRRPGRQSPGLLWEGRRASDFWLEQAAPGTITEVPNPTEETERVLRMAVADSDVAPATPTENPRAQLLSPPLIHGGMELWWHASFYLPRDFPTAIPDWLAVLEGPYGPPWAGTPPFSISVDEDEFRWQRNRTYGWDVPWRAPLKRGRWTDVLVHLRYARHGFVELWIDGEPITFFRRPGLNPNDEKPTTRLRMRTMDSSNDGADNFVVLQNYRKVGMFDSVSVFQGPTRLGRTRSSVDG